MVSAPRTTAGWLVFVGGVVALYVAILVVNTDVGPLQVVTTGGVAGLSIAIIVALLVVVWRGVPALLVPDDDEPSP